METIELPSGHKLGLAVAPFKSASKLRRVLAAELLSVNLDVDVSKLSLEMDVSKLDARGLNTLKNLFCKLLSSEAVENVVFECAARCTLEGKKIDPALFDDETLRADFVPVAQEVMKLNAAPFFASLGSLFSTSPGTPSGSPGSGST